MKTRSLFFLAFLGLFILGGVLSVNAQQLGNPIEFSIDDDTPGGPGIPKGPVLMPTVWQSGYLLDFDGGHDAYVLRLVDSADNVVYSTVVPSYQSQLWLPTYLLGYYRIELLTATLLFYGYITL
jgi:hypothetical protein